MTQALAPTNPGEALAAILSDAERLKGIDVDKLERLFDLGRSMAADAARREFAEAFTRVQCLMAPVHKAAKGHHGSPYAMLEKVQEMLHPLMQGEGFSYSTSMADCPIKDHERIVLTLRHVGGHWETHFYDAPIDVTGPKGEPTKTRLHGSRSTWSYCERTLLTKVWGVVETMDDDGAAGARVGPGSKRITTDQLTDLEALISEVGADRGRFMFWLGVKDLSDLPAGKLRAAVDALELKR